MVTASRAILPLLQRESLLGNTRDFFVAAYRMVAEIGSAFDLMPLDKVVEYAIAGLAPPNRALG